MNRLLSLSEMATVLNRSPKTLKSLTEKYNIPHYQLGSSLMYDPAEVRAHLSVKKEKQLEKTPIVRYSRKKGGSVFAERLGI